jgi:hypothetical protein
MTDPAFLEQLGPDVLGEREVSRVVAVEVPDLPPAHPERKFSPPSGSGFDARPRRDFVRDLLTWGS